MQGFTDTVAACSGVMDGDFGSFKRFEERAMAWLRHVPNAVCRIIAMSPGLKSVTDEPIERTCTAASLPGTAWGVGVPRVVVKVGFEG